MEVFKRENKIKLDAVNDCLFQFKILDKYPGKETLEKAKELFTDINNKKGVSKFFPYVCGIEEELLFLGEELELVLAFFNGTQKKIFEDACSVYDIYESNGNLINNTEISDTASEIKKIIDMPEPYSEIRRLPELNNAFNTRFDEILEEKRNIVINGVDGDFDSVISKLTDEELKKEFENRIILSFDTLKAKLSSEKNMAVINGYTTQSENIKNKFENEIQEFINNRSDTIPVPLPSEVNVDIKDIVHSTRVKLESEQDIDKFFENIKKELKNKLGDADSINLRL